jgi:hypothetical protein
MSTERKDCKYCDHGLQAPKAEVRVRCAETAVKELAALEPEDDKNMAARDAAIQSCVRALSMDLFFDQSLQRHTTAIMSKRKLGSQTAVAGHGVMLARIINDKTERFLFAVPGTDIYFLCSNLIAQDRPLVWDVVVFAGLATDTVDTDFGRIVVLQRGIVMKAQDVSRRSLFDQN